jgi:glycosyltransferase involved in cell wall biosynthesis
MDTDDWEGPGGWNERERYSAAQRAVFARQERWGLVHADGVTVASRALETLAWAQGVAPERVTYLPNAVAGAGQTVAAAPTSPGPFASGPEPRLLLYTRFFEFDLDRPLAVLAAVRARWPGVRLVVAGRGLFGEEQGFLSRAAALGLGEAVDYRGWVESGASGDLFAAADVALYPFDDTLVNRTKSAVKLLELMAAGLPVVAEAVGQNAEVIEPGVSGLLVPPGDVAAFGDAVAGLLDDPARRLALGRAAAERVASAFNWDRRVVDLEAAYAGARERRKPG